jgi:hemoglobin
MERQAAKQKAFLTMVTGGPANYTGQDMRKGHAHLVAQGLNDDHFDAVVELLAGTLAELGANPADIAEVGALANSVRDDVLNREPVKA